MLYGNLDNSLDVLEVSHSRSLPPLSFHRSSVSPTVLPRSTWNEGVGVWRNETCLNSRADPVESFRLIEAASLALARCGQWSSFVRSGVAVRPASGAGNSFSRGRTLEPSPSSGRSSRWRTPALEILFASTRLIVPTGGFVSKRRGRTRSPELMSSRTDTAFHISLERAEYASERPDTVSYWRKIYVCLT